MSDRKSVGIIGLGKLRILHAGTANRLLNSHIHVICESEEIVRAREYVAFMARIVKG